MRQTDRNRGVCAAAQRSAGPPVTGFLLREERRLRRRELVRIAWRDLTGRAALGEVLADLTQLADTAIDVALRH